LEKAVFTLTAVIAIALGSLIIGCIIGAVLTRTLSPQEQRAKSMENRLKESEHKLNEYQQEVTQHFADTAQLVNNLTQSYRDVHEHLSSNALKLANVDISRQLISGAGSDDKILGDASINEEDFQPPKDWAPKVPGEEGTLSESFGLGEEEDDSHSELGASKLGK
jgi:uncharacterized membrane-anchored protein YhcB (DUF1043 family)